MRLKLSVPLEMIAAVAAVELLVATMIRSRLQWTMHSEEIQGRRICVWLKMVDVWCRTNFVEDTLETD